MMASIFFMRSFARPGVPWGGGFNEVAGLVPVFFAAFAWAFKDLWGLPTGEARLAAHYEGRLLGLRAMRPAICQASRVL
jgi:hypothetical protein